MRLFSSKNVIASMLLGASLLAVPGCSLDVAQYSTGRLQILVEDTAGNPVPQEAGRLFAVAIIDSGDASAPAAMKFTPKKTKLPTKKKAAKKKR